MRPACPLYLQNRRNVIEVIINNWKSTVVRIPICGSAWTQNYRVRDWGQAEIATYKEWVDIAIQKIRSAGKVAIIDLHLWAIAKMSKGTEVQRGTFTRKGQNYNYEEWEDGCTGINQVDGVDSCAPEDWYTADPTIWQCAIANADGVTLNNAYKNKEHILEMWADIANRYKDDSGVWFELFNEPYTRKAAEFGSFDCSSPFVKTLLTYLNEHGISYTAWALWPQNSGGPGGLGACGYPSVMTSATEGPGDFRQCLDLTGCQQLIQPLPWAGQVIYDDLMSH
jgi:hypothetical protein